MSKENMSDIITIAKPHTIKKFELIEKYVDEWARKILGFKGKYGYAGSKGVIYIDCMSSSGMYMDVEGNFVEGTALRVARKLNEIIPKYPDKNATLVFNDYNDRKIQYLEERIRKENLTNIEVSYDCTDCDDFLRGLDLDDFKTYNVLLLYDPYKAAIDWDAVTPFLNRWGEVIINHMVSDTTRGVSQAKNLEVIGRYQETYQNDINSIIEIGNDKEKLNKIFLEIINNRRDKNRSKMYIASFPFFNRKNGLIYNLIHCTSSIEGTKLFKKLAWKTFDDKSSLKNNHGNEYQMEFCFEGEIPYKNPTDDYCYCVRDIVDYVYDKFHTYGTVKLKKIYDDLDKHPIFPSDGYKDEIKKGLKNKGVVIRQNIDVIFPKQTF